MVQHVRQLCEFMEMDDMMQLLPTDDKTVVCLGHDRQPYGPGQCSIRTRSVNIWTRLVNIWTMSVSSMDQDSDHVD